MQRTYDVHMKNTFVEYEWLKKTFFVQLGSSGGWREIGTELEPRFS
jgi:hypothetical protein